MRGLLNYNIAAFESENRYGFPELAKYTGQVECAEWVDFDTAVTAKHSEVRGLHFFDSDYKLERLWQYPQRYISVPSRFQYVIQPDFSLYYNFPTALQIYNKYRNHWLAAYYAVHDWSLLGYPKNSTVAFSDIGCCRNKEDKRLLMASYEEMIKQLQPSQVLYFTRSKTAPEGATMIQIPYRKGL